MRRAFVALAFLALASCSTAPAVSADVAAAVQTLTVLERLALLYASLPRCTVAPSPCSQQAVVDNIKLLDSKAYAAVKLAESNPALLSAAIDAISAFRSATPIIY